MVEDACFERSEASHAIALCDLNAKYADVIDSEEVLAFMEGLPRGMFNLPKGPARKAAE
jgi:isochorismate hydrolase